MTARLHRLGALCVRHRFVVLVAWLLVAVALGTWASRTGTEVDDDVTLPGTGSQQAADVLAQRFGSGTENGTNPIVLRAPAGAKLTDPPYRQAVERVLATYGDDMAVLGIGSPLHPMGATQLSPDGRIGYISLKLRDGPAQLTTAGAQHVLDVAKGARTAGIEVAAGGYAGADLSQPGSAGSEATGLPIAIVVLLIGLGVGIDYALFVVTRHRAQRAAGVELRESIAQAIATAGGAVVLAGGTVTIALCSLLLAGIPIVTQLGYLSAIAVLVAVVAALTLLPAALAIAGPRIDALALPGRGARRRPAGEAGHGTGAASGAGGGGGTGVSAGGAPATDGAWARWAHAVAARPWPALAGGLVVIALLALPLRTLQLGQSDTGQLPRDTTARQAYDWLSEGFGPGVNGPLLVAVAIARPGPDAVEQVAQLGDALTRTPGVVAVSSPLPAPSGRAVLFSVTPSTAPSARATQTLVRTLRDTVIPAATRGTPLRASVGGATAGFIDLASEISDRLPVVIAIVLALSFLLLLAAFRAPLVALKAVLMNLLSIGAAFGIVTFTFGHGRSAQLLGLDGVSPIVAFVPLMMFAILFGLSMDYEVFLMTHVRERWKATGDAHDAVVEGLAGTARVITSAALIMVAVFCAFLLDGSPAIKQFGLGMAAAVAVDATLIRCLLVPAILALLGRHAWWTPRWLA